MEILEKYVLSVCSSLYTYFYIYIYISTPMFKVRGQERRSRRTVWISIGSFWNQICPSFLLQISEKKGCLSNFGGFIYKGDSVDSTKCLCTRAWLQNVVRMRRVMQEPRHHASNIYFGNFWALTGMFLRCCPVTKKIAGNREKSCLKYCLPLLLLIFECADHRFVFQCYCWKCGPKICWKEVRLCPVFEREGFKV